VEHACRSESAANLLRDMEVNFGNFSEYALISFKVLPDFDSTMRRFESSRPSQPVRRLETSPSAMPQRPANGGLLRIGYRSPGSEIGVSGSEIADSLRRIFEIFPFSGDCDRRPGSIGTAWRTRQCNQWYIEIWQMVRSYW
jgi:hypothetical protein